MTNSEVLKTCSEALSEVFWSGKYSTIALDEYLKHVDGKDKSLITYIFYGVLDKNLTIEYLLSQCMTTKPKREIYLLLKIATFLLRFSDTANYAVVDNMIVYLKARGKVGVTGFVNAVLRKVVDIDIPNDLSVAGVSLSASCPEWLVGKIAKDYGIEFAKAMLTFREDSRSHIRPSKCLSASEFSALMSRLGALPDKFGMGYYVSGETLYKLDNAYYTTQSLSSMEVVRALDFATSGNVLDLCSAPGGKSIYLKSLHPNLEITCCDLYPHRVELIRKYASRMGEDVNAVVNDATILNNEWLEKYDYVMCDAPCSGSGVMFSKPDIKLNRKPEDVLELVALQKQILDTAKQYCKVGGYLLYSTCSVLKQENDKVINDFLAKNNNFTLSPIDTNFADIDDGIIRLFPHIHNTNGFYAVLVKRNS